MKWAKERRYLRRAQCSFALKKIDGFIRSVDPVIVVQRKMSREVIEVPFIRKLPNGKGGIQTIPRPVRIGTMARRFLKAGGWYTIEILPIKRDPERVRICACDAALGEMFGADTDNGPPLLDAIDQLIIDSQRFIQCN